MCSGACVTVSFCTTFQIKEYADKGSIILNRAFNFALKILTTFLKNADGFLNNYSKVNMS